MSQAVVPLPVPALPEQASSDAHLIELWLHGRSAATVRTYDGDAREFLAFAGKPLRAVTVGDVQGFGVSLAHLATASQARKLSSVKSLLAYGHRLGYLPFNVGAPVRLPAIKAKLAERIVGEEDVLVMLRMEQDPRNKALLSLLYRAGLRISEAGAVCWRDLSPRQEGGQATVFGKGGKTRVVLLPAGMWKLLQEIRPADASAEAPLFLSAKGGPLSCVQIHRIVKAAAKRAGIAPELSAHWLRHAHASHALDRGAPIHLVQQTLGHASVATTGRYLHARPNDGSSRYLPG